MTLFSPLVPWFVEEIDANPVCSEIEREVEIVLDHELNAHFEAYFRLIFAGFDSMVGEVYFLEYVWEISMNP